MMWPAALSQIGRTLSLFLPIALLIGIGALFIHKTELQRQHVVYTEQGREVVLTTTLAINYRLQAISRDVLYLAEHFENQDAASKKIHLATLAADWISFSQVKQSYDHIRWLDEHGIERLNVQYARPKPLVLAPAKINDKAMSDFFAQTSKLNYDEIFISILDPDSAQGTPERTYRSKICVGTPLFDRTGQRHGIVLFGYSAAVLLEHLGQVTSRDGSKAWLVNHKGRWMMGREAANEWGFIPESDTQTISARYPETWRRILMSRNGQFMTAAGLWTFDTVFPMLGGEKNGMAARPTSRANDADFDHGRYLWKMVSLIPAAEYRSHMQSFDTKLGASVFLLLTLFFIGSWLMARARMVEQTMRRSLEDKVEQRNRDLAKGRRLENALHASELFARATIDALAAEICVLDETGTIVAVNRAWQEFYKENNPDLGAYQKCSVGANYLRVCDGASGLHAEQAAPMAAGIRAVIAGERAVFLLEYSCPSPSEQRWFRVSVTPFQGAIQQVVLTHENITERKKAETELQLSATVYKAIGEAILVTNADSVIVAINPAFTQLTGYLETEVVGQSTKTLSSGRNGKEFYRTMRQVLEKTGHWQGKIWTRHKDGSETLQWLRINTIYGEHGSVQQRTGMYSRITDQQMAEQALWDQANFDPLTGLPNRSMFHDRLEQEIKKAHRAGLPLALMFLDLDHFKDVNDTLGHEMGDMLLKETAQQLRHSVRDVDTVARLGGDEFTIILGSLDDCANVERVAYKILQNLAQPFQLGMETVYISASIGITMYPADATEISSLLKNADQAMYAAKNLGRNQFHYFTPSMQETAQHRMRLASDLRGALAGKQFQVVYQPIVELASGVIAKAEALIRWQHPVRGLVSPVEFIPVAEEAGIINDIGDWVLREAARLVARWRSLYHEQFQITVNMSPVQFRKACASQASCQDERQHQLQAYGAGEIVIEITEGLLLDASAAVTDQLLLFRDAGIQVSLDDFGTGYSSLSYLKKFDIDYLKIDRSFVLKLEADSDNMALCEAIIMMAHKLGMKVIAEGIETARQRDLLDAAGCDFAQGFLFSRGVPAEDLERMLKTGLAM